jgi:hypothetical protein
MECTDLGVSSVERSRSPVFLCDIIFALLLVEPPGSIFVLFLAGAD